MRKTLKTASRVSVFVRYIPSESLAFIGHIVLGAEEDRGIARF